MYAAATPILMTKVFQYLEFLALLSHDTKLYVMQHLGLVHGRYGGMQGKATNFLDQMF